MKELSGFQLRTKLVELMFYKVTVSPTQKEDVLRELTRNTNSETLLECVNYLEGKLEVR